MPSTWQSYVIEANNNLIKHIKERVSRNKEAF
jgi:hypothetical protein